MKIFRPLACAMVLLACVGASWAAHAVSMGGALVVNGVEVLALRTGGASARASAAASRVRSAPEGAAVTVRRIRQDYVVRLGKIALVTATGSEARAAGVSTSQLAGKWAANLRAALALPPLKIVQPSLRVPLGQNRPLKLVGSKAHAATWRSEPPGLLEASRTADGVFVKGRKLGSGSLVFVWNGREASAEVEVQPFAATFPQHISALVSGLPAQEEIVRGAVEASLTRQLQRVPGSKLSVQVPPLWAVSAGQARTLDIRVRAEAPGAFPAEGKVRVTVRNLGLGYARDEELWYSNNPENVKQPTLLMEGQLAAGKAVRLLYHHINDSPAGLYVQVEAVNPSETPARMLVIPGDSEPDKNPVLAGIVAAERYLKRWVAASGEVLTLPAKSRTPLALRRLGPKDTMSGLCSLWLLEGGPRSVEIRVDARPPQTLEAFAAGNVKSEAPWRYLEPWPVVTAGRGAAADFAHVYPNPFRDGELTLSVGGRHGFVRIGQHPIARADQNGALSGNFGVLYKIGVAAENPTDTSTDVELVFEASAGYSGALFVLDGNLMRTPLLHPKKTARILRMRLVPGQAKRFELYTMPLSGSSYPATLILRPIQADTAVDADLTLAPSNKL
jgi:hypothetical protein